MMNNNIIITIECATWATYLAPIKKEHGSILRSTLNNTIIKAVAHEQQMPKEPYSLKHLFFILFMYLFIL